MRRILLILGTILLFSGTAWAGPKSALYALLWSDASGQCDANSWMCDYPVASIDTTRADFIIGSGIWDKLDEIEGAKADCIVVAYTTTDIDPRAGQQALACCGEREYGIGISSSIWNEVKAEYSDNADSAEAVLFLHFENTTMYSVSTNHSYDSIYSGGKCYVPSPSSFNEGSWWLVFPACHNPVVAADSSSRVPIYMNDHNVRRGTSVKWPDRPDDSTYCIVAYINGSDTLQVDTNIYYKYSVANGTGRNAPNHQEARARKARVRVVCDSLCATSSPFLTGLASTYHYRGIYWDNCFKGHYFDWNLKDFPDSGGTIFEFHADSNNVNSELAKVDNYLDNHTLLPLIKETRAYLDSASSLDDGPYYLAINAAGTWWSASSWADLPVNYVLEEYVPSTQYFSHELLIPDDIYGKIKNYDQYNINVILCPRIDYDSGDEAYADLSTNEGWMRMLGHLLIESCDSTAYGMGNTRHWSGCVGTNSHYQMKINNPYVIDKGCDTVDNWFELMCPKEFRTDNALTEFGNRIGDLDTLYAGNTRVLWAEWDSDGAALRLPPNHWDYDYTSATAVSVDLPAGDWYLLSEDGSRAETPTTSIGMAYGQARVFYGTAGSGYTSRKVRVRR